jgi:hypothetical protein
MLSAVKLSYIKLGEVGELILPRTSCYQQIYVIAHIICNHPTVHILSTPSRPTTATTGQQALGKAPRRIKQVQEVNKVSSPIPSIITTQNFRTLD